MPKFLLEGNYTAEGIKGVRAEGGARRYEAAKNAAESLGGRLESLYFAFGAYDVVAICDMPDNASMAALTLAITASGAMEARTTVLLTVEEMDHAASKPTAYRRPGA